MDKVLYIIDASAYIHRAYHAIRPLTTSAGIPTNAVYGFIKLINKIKGLSSIDIDSSLTRVKNRFALAQNPLLLDIKRLPLLPVTIGCF